MSILAVDIGGSGSRALLRNTGERIAHGEPLKISDGILDVSDSLRTLADGLQHDGSDFDAVAVGLASLIAYGDPDAIAEQVRQQWPCRRLILTSDSVAAVASVWGLAGGAIVAAGTGVVGLGTDFDQTWSRIDGWGQQLGDAGGGAWIGERGLRAALRAADGRAGGSSMLLRAAAEQFGDPSRLPATINAAESVPRALAGFAPAVVAAADNGDASADRIIADAAQELALTAVAALAEGVPRRVALVGGIAAVGGRLAARFTSEVMRVAPDVAVGVGGAEPVRGAATIAETVAAGSDSPASTPPYLYRYDFA